MDALLVVVEVTGEAPMDVCALLVDATGAVRSDADVVSRHRPKSPGVRLEPGPAGASAAVRIDTSAVPAAVDRIVVAVNLDRPGTQTTGHVGTPTAVVRDAASGRELSGFKPTGLAAETAVLLLEIYRRGPAWKVRAVGQGYANGLAGIAADFGVPIDDTPQPTPRLPPRPTSPPPTSPPPSSSAPVSLDKGLVILSANQSVMLGNRSGIPFTRFRMGLGWDPARFRSAIDLDASCVAFDAWGGTVDIVFFAHLHAFHGAIAHSGDNLTGAGAGDDEVISVHLDRMPADVHALVFTVTSYRGQKLTRISRAFCRLVDDPTNTELVRFELSGTQPRTAVLMCKLVRQGPVWIMTALGEFADGRTVLDLIAPARSALMR
ncbi:MAG TPA: TerD family protein, partial [Yinghuangia sp.]|nr:TerD family protein [Yinghuangia sp.]